MAADGDRDWDVGDRLRVAHIGVEQFGLFAHEVAHVTGPAAVGAGCWIEGGGGVVVAGRVVGGIVPALGGDIEAQGAAFAGEFGDYVYALAVGTGGEGAVAVIGVDLG